MLAVGHDKIRTCPGFSVGLETYAIFVPGGVAKDYLVNVFFVGSRKDLVLKKSTNR